MDFTSYIIQINNKKLPCFHILYVIDDDICAKYHIYDS